MPETTPSSLEDSRHSGRGLFALKRIAGALQAGLLTYDEAKAAATRISIHYSDVFDRGDGSAAQKAERLIRIIEVILERRFPKRFRADSQR